MDLQKLIKNKSIELICTYINKIVLRNYKHDQKLSIIYLLLLNYAIYKRKL